MPGHMKPGPFARLVEEAGELGLDTTGATAERADDLRARVEFARRGRGVPTTDTTVRRVRINDRSITMSRQVALDAATAIDKLAGVNQMRPSHWGELSPPERAALTAIRGQLA